MLLLNYRYFIKSTSLFYQVSRKKVKIIYDDLTLANELHSIRNSKGKMMGTVANSWILTKLSLVLDLKNSRCSNFLAYRKPIYSLF